LARIPLLITDDFGVKPLRPPADEDFHALIAERNEQTTTIVTGNLDFEEWGAASRLDQSTKKGSHTADRFHNPELRLS
jgi:DNA replication protein DnaC